VAGKIAVIFLYFTVNLAIGLWSRRHAKENPDDYFLGGRSLGPVLLFLTMAATNFSAFTIFGFSGEGYRTGYAFYPVMAFGTGFMAIAFCFIGKKACDIGKKHGYISPAELIGRQYGSRFLQVIVFLVMVVFTLPYIAIQPISAGYMLESILGIPYFTGGVLVMAVVVFYTFLGGFRGVVWTDALQGVMMVALMVLALIVITLPHGGLIKANTEVFSKVPQLFSRPGSGGAFPVPIWLSYMLLWLLCDPLFPQIFQRFLVARNRRSLDLTMAAYPVITGFLFLLPVTIGVIGRLSFPGLSGKEADRILPLLIHQRADNALGALIMTAGLAALMSTLCSQLLTLSSMLSRDLLPPSGSERRQAWTGKLFVLFLAIAGLAIAYRPPSTLLKIATEAFTGLAVLFPAVVGGLYWPSATASGAIVSILVGEALVAGYACGLLPTFGFLPAIPVVGATSLVFVLTSRATSRRKQEERSIPSGGLPESGGRRKPWPAAIALGALFLLSIDFWAWGSDRPLIFGYPWWIWYFIGLHILLVLAMVRFLTDEK
jgi:solute:Na+ symporter, SSS family